MLTVRDWFPIVPLTVMTRGLCTEGSKINSCDRQTTHNTGTILLKANLKTNLHQRGYRSLVQYKFADNIKHRVETGKENINPVNLLNPRALYVIADPKQLLPIGPFPTIYGSLLKKDVISIVPCLHS